MQIEKTQSLTIYPWNISITQKWTREGLEALRDKDPEEIAEIVWMTGEENYCNAFIELAAHGLQQKAAEVARALVKKHPIVKDLIIESLGEDTSYFLLQKPLASIPNKPQEYPKHIEIEYVNKFY